MSREIISMRFLFLREIVSMYATYKTVGVNVDSDSKVSLIGIGFLNNDIERKRGIDNVKKTHTDKANDK